MEPYDIEERKSFIKCITFLIRSYIFVIISVAFLVMVGYQYPKIVEEYGMIPLLHNLIYYIVGPSIPIISITKFIDCIILNEDEDPSVWGDAMSIAYAILSCALALLIIIGICVVYGEGIFDFFKNLFQIG